MTNQVIKEPEAHDSSFVLSSSFEISSNFLRLFVLQLFQVDKPGVIWVYDVI